MGIHIIKKCSSSRSWSFEELMMLQQLTDPLRVLTRKNVRRYQRENTLWVIREAEQKTIVGMASLSRVHTLDPSKAFGIVHSVKLCEAFDDNPYLEKKLRTILMESIIDYASKKKLQYIQVESAPGEKKASDLYPHFGFHRVAQRSNAVHGTNFDRLYLFSEVY